MILLEIKKKLVLFSKLKSILVGDESLEFGYQDFESRINSTNCCLKQMAKKEEFFDEYNKYAGELEKLYNSGDFVNVIKICKKILKKNKYFYFANELIAHSNYGIKNYQEALDNYTITILKCNAAFEDVNHDIYFYRGMCKYFIDDFEGAIKDYSEAINRDTWSEESSYYEFRGYCNDELGNLNEARIDYTKALEINLYKDADIYYARGIVSYKLDEYKYAIKDINLAIKKTNDKDEKIKYKENLEIIKMEEKSKNISNNSTTKKEINSELPLVSIPEEEETIDKNVSDKALKEAIKRLDNLVGLVNIKKEVNGIITFAKLQIQREKLGFKRDNINNNFIFLGSPGTGKTEIARLMGKILCALGLLKKGHFVETDRSGLVGSYIGQTSKKTLSKCQEALGGVLFIDEAYSLTSDLDDDYGSEAISTLLKFMEDNKGNISVIVAGYSLEMEKFLDSNSGLRSRFNTTLNFKDYTDKELFDIVLVLVKERERKIDNESINYVKDLISIISNNKKSNFGNGRSMRNLVEIAIKKQSFRLIKNESNSKNDFINLISEDFSLNEEQLLNI